MRHGFVFILFYLVMSGVFPLLAGVEGLGESLLLEGRVALTRGESWILSCQLPDGSWQRDPVLTAQAGMLLANSDADYYKEHLHKAVRWILNNEKQLNSAGQFAQVLRLPLRMNNPELPELVKYFQEQKSSWDLPEEPAVSRQWLLEAHFLLPEELGLLSIAEVEQIQQDFLQRDGGYQALTLLTLLSRCTSQGKIPELEELRAACVRQSFSAEPDVLFWIVRALRASERFLPVNAKTWRAVIVSRILEKQSGQGAFAGSDSAEDLSATVFFLQMLQLCLAE